ncbi:T-cell surface antigen CD2-like [Boleophthalmus pectinirostris]|uniref:T-cell surface antigen CD2-like n=1 Tax=Boleophthalmus pectinirostris TaxID=150288 RepID=UPI00242C6C98|nr:T-cell surface antigen CD2-like [Boleophthalmus pectinirostris]
MNTHFPQSLDFLLRLQTVNYATTAFVTELTMAHFIILVILPAFLEISTARRDTCDLLAAVGIRLTICPFVYEKLTNTEKLVWMHNHTVIYQRDKGKVSVGRPEDITSSGSLVLTNPKLTSAGVYQAQVYNMTGALMKSWSSFLCVMEKVPKPKLTYSCDKKSAMFNCDTVKSQDLRYAWTMDGKILMGETKSMLTIPLSKLKSKNSFTCSVSNQVSNEISDNVIPICPPSSQNLLCFPHKTVIAVLAGAAGIVIVLIIVIIALCCNQRRNKTPKRREKEEPRMLSLTRREVEADYETMHVPQSSQQPSPNPSPRAEHSEPKHEAEAGCDSLQPAAPKQGYDPSPVPKPRTKRPKTPDI